MSAAEDAPRRGPRWGLYAPFLLLGVIAAAWSGGWWWAADKASQTVDVWLAREAARGRTYACGERTVGGYPFRIEIDCRNPTARWRGGDGETAASAPRFLAVAQVYDPKRVIGELTGPVAIASPDGRKADLSFSTAQSSVAVDGRRFERGSLVIKTPRLVTAEGEIGAAQNFEAHLRRSPDGASGAYDLAMGLDGAVSPWLDLLPAGQGPASLELQVSGTGVGELEPGPMTDRLRAFATGGGQLKVAVARISRGDIAAQAKGDLTLDDKGRANGELSITARGVDDIVRAMAGGGEDEGGMSSLLGLGAKMLGKPDTLDDRPATRYRLKIDRGRVMLGPVRLTRLPPAF